MVAVPVLIVVGLVLVGALASVRILKQYERGVQFRLGKVQDEARGPGPDPDHARSSIACTVCRCES